MGHNFAGHSDPDSTAEARDEANGNALAEKLGIHIVELSSESATATMPVLGNTQPAGFIHGGATAALCENLASAAANAHARQLGRVAVGTELTVAHLRPATTGHVHAQATSEHLGRTRCVHRVTVRDDQGRTLSTALVTNLLVEG